MQNTGNPTAASLLDKLRALRAAKEQQQHQVVEHHYPHNPPSPAQAAHHQPPSFAATPSAQQQFRRAERAASYSANPAPAPHRPPNPQLAVAVPTTHPFSTGPLQSDASTPARQVMGSTAPPLSTTTASAASTNQRRMSLEDHAAHAASRVARNVQRWASLGAAIPASLSSYASPLSHTLPTPPPLPAMAADSATSGPVRGEPITTLPHQPSKLVNYLDDDEDGVDLFEPDRGDASAASTQGPVNAPPSTSPTSIFQKMQELNSKVYDARHKQLIDEITRKPSSSSFSSRGRGRGGKRERQENGKIGRAHV